MAVIDRNKEIKELFKNVALNSDGVLGELYGYLRDGEVAKAVNLMDDHDTDVDEALNEYWPQKHKVMSRPNKNRKDRADYVTEKLPRGWQRYINEVELFFLLPDSVRWTLEEGRQEDFDAFMRFLDDVEFDSNMRLAKRLAGSETESAKLYHIYRNEGDGGTRAEVRCKVLARSTGYRLRPLIDQYGRMIAFGYGYNLKENGRSVEHWDFQTAEFLFYSRRRSQGDGGGWETEVFENPTGRINVVYYHQEKAWANAERRIEREEFLDSKTGDTNNYFADPIAAATADVIQNLAGPDSVGKLIQLTSPASQFQYINPPQGSETHDTEKSDLHYSILFDTLTPDLSFDALKGMGTLSGAAIRNSMTMGMIKRAKNLEIYGSLLKKEKNVILGILGYLNNRKDDFEAMHIKGEFPKPFEDDPTMNIEGTPVADMPQSGKAVQTA